MTAKCIAPTGAPCTRYGERPAYQEGLWEIGRDVYAWMVPNGSWGEANAGLVVGQGQSLLVDTLWDVRHTRTMLDAMAPVLRGAPIRTLVNTHADGDHFWGNQLVEDAESVTSAASRREMNAHKPRSMLAFERLGRALGRIPLPSTKRTGHWFRTLCAPYRFGEVIHTPAATTFTGTAERDVGGRRVRLIEVGPAHTQGDLMVHVPDARVLFAGDILFIGSTPVMWAGPVENWLRALDTILDMDVDTIVPGHGPLTGKDGVEAVRAYWRFTDTAARGAYDKRLSPETAARRIVTGDAFRSKPFAKWDSPERMMTNVHVLYRHYAGRTGRLSVAAKLGVMRKQALLAHALPDATPAVMHREDASL